MIHQYASEVYKSSRGENRKQLKQLIDCLESSPFMTPGHSYEDRKVRFVQQIHVNNYVVDFIIDHALREVKIPEINKLQ